MTDSPSSDTPEDGPPAQPQPWFPPADLGPASPPPAPGSTPPAGQPGSSQPGYSHPGYGQPGYRQPGYGQPGYGQPGHRQAGPGQTGPGQTGYGPPPPGPGPRYGESAPKPGVIPLRPLGLGEILDGSFATIRRNPKATLGIAAVIMTISAVISSTLTVSLVNLPSPGQNLTSRQAEHLLGRIFAEALPVLGVTVLLTIIVQALLAGLLAPIIAREAGGQQISAGDAWRAAAPRLPSVLLATLLVLLAGLGPLLALGFILLLAFAAGAPAAVYAVIGVPGFFVAVVLSIWFSTMFSLVTPVVVLERERPGAALARSWRLVRRSFWRVFGIMLLASIIVAVAGAILQLPFTFLSTLFGGTAGFTAGTVIAVIGTIAAGTVTRPISAAVTVLLYVDMRMRKEGLDLALRTAAGAGPLADSDFAAAWRPPRPGQPAAAAPPGTPGAPPTTAGGPPPW